MQYFQVLFTLVIYCSFLNLQMDSILISNDLSSHATWCVLRAELLCIFIIRIQYLYIQDNFSDGPCKRIKYFTKREISFFLLTIKYKWVTFSPRLLRCYIPLFITLKTKMLMNVPKEKDAQTRCFKEHLFSFTKREERWHFTCR